jgi:hypothetical protein
MVEIIKTYTGTMWAQGTAKMTIGYAYRCIVCEFITINKDEAKTHLTCKEKHNATSY